MPVEPPLPLAANQMGPGAFLEPRSHLVSSNGRHVFALQTDGNQVLYTDGAVRWSTRTDGVAVAHLAMQGDGNRVEPVHARS